MAKAGQPQWHDLFVHDQDQSESYTESETSDDLSDLLQNDLDTRPFSRLPYSGVTNHTLLGRELGSSSRTDQIVSSVRRDLTSFRSWIGTSKDILSVAWGPRDTFAIGASADHLDQHGIPYNRNNNLLYGDLTSDSLFELSAHRVTLPEAQGSGPRLADPSLFTTVSQVTFANHQPILYSAGYDRTVRVWDCARHCERPNPVISLHHECFVDFAIPLPTRSENDPQLLATGQQSRTKPVQLFGLGAVEHSPATEDVEGATKPIATLNSERAEKYSIHPSAIQWGPDAHTRRFLLAGFAEHSAGDLADREGHLTIWDVSRPDEPFTRLETATENVFDIAWQPGNFVIAAATTPRNTRSMTHGRDTKSVIRTWSPSTEGSRRIFELECPARDVNELKFHPTRNIICASCTDGCTYVWDLRSPETILAALHHGRPIETFEAGKREELDVGVRFSAWAQNGRYLYTGGSDGRLACWDVLTMGEDEHPAVQEVAKFDAGIMAGAFSSDETKLLLGLVKGSVELLSVGACSISEEIDDASMYLSNTEKFGNLQYMPAEIDGPPDEEGNMGGVDIARDLLQSGQLVLNSVYGVGQGPKYQGPWSRFHRSANCTDPGSEPLQPDIAAQQFDRSTRKAGIKIGGLANNAKATKKANETRRNARLAMRNVHLRPLRKELKDRASLHPEFVQNPLKGPNTMEFGSLSELARFGDPEAQPSSQQETNHRVETPRDVRASSANGIEPTIVRSKRAATDELNLVDRKRSQTPKPAYSQQDHLGPRISTGASQPATSLAPMDVSGLSSGNDGMRQMAALDLPSKSYSQQQYDRNSSLFVPHGPHWAPSQRASYQQVNHSHPTSGDPVSPPIQLIHSPISHGAVSMQIDSRITASTNQPDVIDLCDSDEDGPTTPDRKSVDDRHPLKPIADEVSTAFRPGATTSVRDFKQPTTPSRGGSRSRSRNSPHENLSQPNISPHTPTARDPRRDSKSPSLRRNLSVIPSSPGQHGFEIPARVQRNEEAGV